MNISNATKHTVTVIYVEHQRAVMVIYASEMQRKYDYMTRAIPISHGYYALVPSTGFIPITGVSEACITLLQIETPKCLKNIIILKIHKCTVSHDRFDIN